MVGVGRRVDWSIAQSTRHRSREASTVATDARTRTGGRGTMLVPELVTIIYLSARADISY
jgi:hypothetical protein